MFTAKENIAIVNQSLKDMVDFRPYSHIICDDDFVQILTEEDHSILRNAVFWSAFDDRNAEERVRQTVAMYKEKGLPFRWVIGPGSEPRDLMQILIRNGFQKIPDGFPGAGMVATYHTTQELIADQNRNSFSFQIVASETQIVSFVEIMESCFQFSVRNDRFLRVAIRDDVEAHPRRLWYFLVCFESIPIGILAARIYDGRFAYLAAGAVLSQFRRMGALKFLGHHVMEFLKDKGITTVTTQTLPNTSENLCKKLGFETVCQVDTLLYLVNT